MFRAMVQPHLKSCQLFSKKRTRLKKGACCLDMINLYALYGQQVITLTSKIKKIVVFQKHMIIMPKAISLHFSVT
jgi:hypothetical protein